MNGNNSYSVIRAIRGPITLITVGALFALQNFTRFGFDQTWPVLLIVFGLLSLMQRGAAPPRASQMPPMPPPPPNAKKRRPLVVLKNRSQKFSGGKREFIN